MMKVVHVRVNKLKALSFLLLLAVCGSSNGQGLLNNGAYITITGGAHIYISGGLATGNFTNQDQGANIGTVSNAGTIDVTGDWVNNSGSNVFANNSGTVELLGSNNQDIKGATTTWFNNLTLSGSGTKTLQINTVAGGGYASPTGVLALNDRPLALNTHTMQVRNPATTAITRTSGYVISEMNAANNTSILRWNAGATNGTYVFPFGVAAGTYIPFTLYKSAGTADLYISTRSTAASDNQPWQTTVTNMNSSVVGGDGSVPVVIDRWWDIYSDNAFTAAADFTYRGIENTTTYSPTGIFAAQNWSGGALWFPPTGSGPGVTTGTAVVSIPAQVMGGTIATPWVLSNIIAPLPVELLSFSARLNAKAVEVEWSTASEINSDYFAVEKSADGNRFEEAGRVAAAGQSAELLHYSFADSLPSQGISYYRLRQVDLDGSFKHSRTVAIYINRETQPDFISAVVDASGAASLVYANKSGETCALILHDMIGKELYRGYIHSSPGINMYVLNLQPYSHGIYYITISNSGKNSTKKIIY